MEQNDIAIAHFVEHAHQVTFAIGGTLRCFHRRYVRDVTVVADVIVVNEIADFLNQAVVAHRDIAQGRIVDTCVFGKAFRHFNLLVE